MRRNQSIARSLRRNGRLRVLNSVVHPTSRLLPVVCVEFFQSGTVGPEFVGDDDLGLTVPPNYFLKEFQGRLLVACLRLRCP